MAGLFLFFWNLKVEKSVLVKKDFYENIRKNRLNCLSNNPFLHILYFLKKVKNVPPYYLHSVHCTLHSILHMTFRSLKFA